MNFEAIPPELKQFRQWVVWRLEMREGASKPTKPPYCPHTGRLAAVDNPTTWGTFEDAVAACQHGGFSGIGFVLTNDDPFFMIDLDEVKPDNPLRETILQTQVKIFETFQTYAERSPSGAGLHIIGRGSVPQGRRRGAIEVYSNERYMTMTGDVYRALPVVDCQGFLSLLWEEMGGKQTAYIPGDLVERRSDREVYDVAANASNGALFLDLWNGNWQPYYGDRSQSEADQALINILAFYTQNRLQIARLFRQSALGQREKAQRDDYVARMTNKGFDQLLPSTDIEAVKASVDEALRRKAATLSDSDLSPVRGVEAERNAQSETSTPANVSEQPVNVKPNFWPHGLVGEIADFIYRQAPYQIPEVATAAALALMAGICGQAYNVNKLGLNLYIMLAAPPGFGKESAATGINTLMSRARGNINANGEFSFAASSNFVGPSGLSSGQALMRHLSKPDQTCFVSIQSEFGLRLRQMASPNASSSETALQRTLLDLYSKSGMNGVVGKTAFADKDKDIDPIRRPAVTLLGESSPRELYGAMSERLVMSGLLPRFISFVYDGKRPKLNKEAQHVEPSDELVSAIQQLVSNALHSRQSDAIMHVQATPEAQAMLDRINAYIDEQINRNGVTEVEQAIWARAYVNVLKVAGLLAIGQNLYHPTISPQDADYAARLVTGGCVDLIGKFERGEVEGVEISEADRQQREAIIRSLRHYVTSDFAHVKPYGVSDKMHADYVIPSSYFQRKNVAVAAFRHDRRGATKAINDMLRHMVDEGALMEVSRHELKEKFGFNGRAYVVGNSDLLGN